MILIKKKKKFDQKKDNQHMMEKLYAYNSYLFLYKSKGSE